MKNLKQIKLTIGDETKPIEDWAMPVENSFLHDLVELVNDLRSQYSHGSLNIKEHQLLGKKIKRIEQIYKLLTGKEL